VARLFDLEHIRAEVRKRLRGVPSRQEARQVKDVDAFERRGRHSRTPFMGRMLAGKKRLADTSVREVR
jgi:hypothetical protein